ncbi:unnamed protein product [Cuscuta epithymum]|uniref:Uncharacterized protein n=1 Tax=Cuscuta epithymum TaxID=186058 RepID=A0AAV0F6E8_9ASTE|nr:unnamed protein product [Cuscuta epithymum]
MEETCLTWKLAHLTHNCKRNKKKPIPSFPLSPTRPPSSKEEKTSQKYTSSIAKLVLQLNKEEEGSLRKKRGWKSVLIEVMTLYKFFFVH